VLVSFVPTRVQWWPTTVQTTGKPVWSTPSVTYMSPLVNLELLCEKSMPTQSH
jgi:hypothetical protein